MEDIHKLFTTTLEIANYYDINRNVSKTFEYSFKLTEEDDKDTVGVTKIVFWASSLKQYDNIYKLMDIIRGNALKIDKLKEIFNRENKMTLRNFLLSKYINIVREKEFLNKINCNISTYLDIFYGLVCSPDIYSIYDAILKEKSDL